jgi:hypothetical protein
VTNASEVQQDIRPDRTNERPPLIYSNLIDHFFSFSSSFFENLRNGVRSSFLESKSSHHSQLLDDIVSVSSSLLNEVQILTKRTEMLETLLSDSRQELRNSQNAIAELRRSYSSDFHNSQNIITELRSFAVALNEKLDNHVNLDHADIQVNGGRLRGENSTSIDSIDNEAKHKHKQWHSSDFNSRGHTALFKHNNSDSRIISGQISFKPQSRNVIVKGNQHFKDLNEATALKRPNNGIMSR